MQQSALIEPAAVPAGAVGDDGQAVADMERTSALQRTLGLLASLRLTLVLLVLLAAGIMAAYRYEAQRTWPLVVPLILLAGNLLAAVASNRAFRRQLPLLVFHLCLVAILLLVAAGRLSYLKGQTELTDGETFAGQLSMSEAGPWHGDSLAKVRFVNEGFTVAYSAGLQRDQTRNRVAWLAADGGWRHEEIGDQEPLRVAGYRFYTSFNKGFAPLFRWQPDSGPALAGAVHLPAYPLHEYRQAREWTPPGGRTPVWVMLQFDELLLDPAKPSEFHLPRDYELVVRVGDTRHTLRPGESLRLADGILTLDELKTWMGYTVFYDWTLPWLFAACAVAAASLGAHFWRRFAAKPWDA